MKTITNETKQNEMMDRADLMRLLRCSPPTLHRLIKAGKIPQPVRLMGHPRWLRTTIINWLESLDNKAAVQQ